MYLGERANYYTHNLGQEEFGPPYGVRHTGMGVELTQVWDEISPGSGTWDFHPAILVKDPLLYNPGDRVEANRTDGSYTNGKLVKPNHIKWHTNSELGRTYSPNTIGGYEITAKNGITYHYLLPVYNKKQISFSRSSASNFNKTTIEDDYPITWLLTGITGPDYIDRGTSGIDEGDWGYWVDFDYGKVSENYMYREPYYGSNVIDINQPGAFNLGQRESYYLNTIKTRSHTALFIKDVRKDGRSAIQNGVSTAISSSLNLDEIILLTNHYFDELVSSSVNLKKNSGNSQILTNGDNLNDVYDVRDLDATINQYVNDHQSSKIKFNYKDYASSLCNNTWNSFDDPNNPSIPGSSQRGKLTLNSFAVYGKNNMKMMPDYLFEYGGESANPDYNFYKQDAWGMYQASDLTGMDLTAHKSKIPNANSKGDEWCLNKITTPLGGEILVDYERDEYSSVSGYQPKMKFRLETDYSEGGVLTSYDKDIDFTDYFTAGQQIEVFATVNFGCTYAFSGSSSTIFPKIQTIIAVSPNSIIVSNPPVPPTPNPGEFIVGDEPCPNSTLGNFDYILFDVISKKGGQNRVKKLSIKDEIGNEYSTEYRYTVDGTENGKSSGVIAKEPVGIRGVNYGFYNFYDFPNTPIMYSKVTVLQGKSDLKEAKEKSVYEFETPHYTMVWELDKQVFDGQVNFIYPNDDVFKLYNFNIYINTSTIGQLKSIKKYM